MTRVVVVGDALLDRDLTGSATRLCPDSAGPVVDVERQVTRPGGAALTAAMLAADGVDVTLLTAVGHDDPGDELRRGVVACGVTLVDAGSRAATPQKVRIRSNGTTIARLDIGTAPAPAPSLGGGVLAVLDGVDAIVASDYGRGLLTRPELRHRLGAVARDVPVVWDPHRLGPAPVAGVAVATPNVGEACAIADADPRSTPAAIARRVATRWGCTVALTCGAAGAVITGRDGAITTVPAPPIDARDACGAGDRFAGRLAVELAAGTPLELAVERAGAAAAHHVGAGTALAGEAASRREVVVAAGGCFDVVHAGHVRMLQYARSLGDRLVVLMNSDASIRRLKGPGRPINHEADRRAVVNALAPVDEVICFDEDDPCAALARLRPDVFVKGAEYEGLPMPEAAVLERSGGRIVFAPMLDGRSTTRVIRLAGGLAG